ncbi:MAG TPA: glycosyltransferase [Flavobacteriales bacterium]|jgi:glycosyltransferase involved in cell wall biosynthesis|nr:glycosyltransferase [Flavobacteriales bacterium]
MAFSLVVLAFFHLVIFRRLAFLKPKVEPDRSLPITVVVCARNESASLQQLIPMLMDQDHGEFEVVVVNDRSEDDTWEVLQWMKPEYPKLRPVNIQADEKFSYGKKIALGVGVRSAKYKHVLLTDADCMPVGRDWISVMAAGFKGGKQIVIAHSPYEKQEGFTNLLERYDGISKAVQYISFAQAGFPYMGVGRDLGYTQELFYAAKGPGRHKHLMSGDDDLFINEVARAKNTAAIADGRSFMTTRATPDLGTWIRRKRRHYTTARYYRFGHQVLLTLLPLARLLLWATIVYLFCMGHYVEAAVGTAVELLLFLPVTMLAMRKLGAGGIIWLALPLEWLFLLLEPCIYLSTLIIKPRRWK